MTRLAPALLSIAFTVQAFGQSSTAPPNFDAAVIKKPSLTDGSTWNLSPAGNLIVRGATLYSLISSALHEPGGRPPEGVPDWLDSERVDLVAKAPPKTSWDGIRPMLLALFAERCKLLFHREKQIRPAYALVIGNHGSKLKDSTAGVFHGCDTSRTPEGLWRELCRGMTLADLSADLPNMDSHDIDKPVVNLTGLTGAYDFALEWNVWRTAVAGTPLEEQRVTLFTAIQTNLGLKLESRKLPIEINVIDHVERPAFDN